MFDTPHRFTMALSILYGTPAFGPFFTEFVYPEYWHFEKGVTWKFDDVLLNYGGLPFVLPLIVHLKFFGWISRGDHSE